MVISKEKFIELFDHYINNRDMDLEECYDMFAVDLIHYECEWEVFEESIWNLNEVYESLGGNYGVE